MTVAQEPYLNVCCKFLIVEDQKWDIPLAQNHMFLHYNDTRRTWAQNGRKTLAFWAQIKGQPVSKGSRINGNFVDVW
jgi:hypothetical protein